MNLEPFLYEIWDSVYYILPSYAANAAPVIFGGGRPIDAGRIFRDGRPLLGPRKTYKGLVSGLLAGELVALAQRRPIEGFLLSLGAVLGDLVGSFIKRRLGWSPGAPLPIVDQLDFVAGALLMASFVSTPTTRQLLWILLVTPPIHLLTNFIAYLLKLKKEPW